MTSTLLMSILFWVLLGLTVASFASTYLCILWIKDEEEGRKWAWRMVGAGITGFLLLALLF